MKSEKLLIVLLLLGPFIVRVLGHSESLLWSAQQNPIQIDANGLTQTLTAGGLVVRGQIVKLNSSGQVVPVLTTDTTGAIGVAATSQTSAGYSVSVSLAGSPLVQIDASGCSAGNIVSISTSTGGAGHCATTASGQQIGVASSVSWPGSIYWVVQLSFAGGGGLNATTASKAIYASDPKYGVVADGLVVYDASWNNAANPVVVTSPTAAFSAARDNNKVCWGIDSTSGTNTAPVGTLTVVNSTTANCSGTATGTSTASAFGWGTDDTAAWLAANAAAAASQTPTCIIGPNGNTVVQKAPLIDPRSTPTWSWCFSGPVGGLTTFLPTGNFDPTTCTGPVASACIWEPHQGNIVQNIVPQYSKLDNIAVNGLTFKCAVGYANKAAFGLQHTEGHNIWAWNWCGGGGGINTFFGITLNSPNSVYNLNANNTGGMGFNFAALAAPTQTFLASSYSGAQLLGGDIAVGGNNIVVSKGNFWQQCTTQCVQISATTATMIMDGDTGTGNSGNQYVDVFGTLIVQGGTQINPANNSGSTILTRATGKAFIQDAVIKETGTSGVAFNVNTVPGGSIINRGNVQTTGTDQTLLVVANVVLSAGWGTTATVTAPTGTPDSNPTRFSFQVNSAGTGQAANPTMAITYPAPVPTTPVWTCKQVGGTGAISQVSGESGATVSAVTLTWNGTPVAGSNYIIVCTGGLQ